MEYSTDHASTLAYQELHGSATGYDGNIGTLFTDVENGSGHENTTAPNLQIPPSFIIAILLERYIPPILLFFGTFGNILSFIVLSRPALNKSATAFYFRVLTVVDTLALNFGLWGEWLRDYFNINIFFETVAACRTIHYLATVLQECAIWVVVIITIQRAIGIQWPHHTRVLFTRFRIRVSVLITAITVAIINIPNIFMLTKFRKKYCDINLHHVYRIMLWVDLIMNLFLPFLVMLVCYAVMINKVCRRDKDLPRSTVSSSSRQSHAKTMALTLFTGKFIYLLLATPFALYLVAMKLMQVRSNIMLFYSVTRYLCFVNYTIDFYLFFIGGKSFRTELKYLCCRRGRGLNSPNRLPSWAPLDPAKLCLNTTIESLYFLLKYS